MRDSHKSGFGLAGVILCAFLTIVSIVPAGTHSGGSGTAADPYQIATKADLLALAVTTTDYGKCFILTADIDLTGETFTTAVIAPDVSSDPLFNGTSFAGKFDGNGYKILNLTINPLADSDPANDQNDYLGLFGQMYGLAEIKNLGIENVSITLGSYSGYIGGLCGFNQDGSIINCYASGTIAGGGINTVGGLCGRSEYGTLDNCYARVHITVGNMSCIIGGLCGFNYYGIITHCHATGNITGGNGARQFGGLCGQNSQGTIDFCYATGSVSGTDEALDLGGLCGYTVSESMTGCFATGDITGGNKSMQIGGLCGSQGSFLGMVNCYATGNVTSGGNSSDLGGLCGSNGGRLVNCHATGQVTSGMNSWHLGGLCGLYARVSSINNRIDNSYATGNVSGGDKAQYLGGLCGEIKEGTEIRNSHATGNVVAGNAAMYLGGLCGQNYQGIISYSYATGHVRGGDTTKFAGGLCGQNMYTIRNCYTTGSVTGGNDSTRIGGLCGRNYFGDVVLSYASGNVFGGDGSGAIGGLCGENNANLATCYARGTVLPFYGPVIGGLVGSPGPFSSGGPFPGFGSFWDVETSGWNWSAGGNGKTTAEMQDINTYLASGWDFSDVDGDPAEWRMIPNWYPVLAWQVMSPAPIPDVTGMTHNRAEEALLAAGYRIGELSHYHCDTITQDLVMSQSPPSGQSVPLGTPVNLAFSLGKAYSGGSGTAENPYRISTVEDLLAMGLNVEDLSRYFILTADIDLAGFIFSHPPIARDTDPINMDYQGTPFNGIFNGNGHTLANLTITADEKFVGLFGYLSQGGQVMNLTLMNPHITGRSFTGAICGYTLWGSFSRCLVLAASVTGYGYVGGLCGGSDEGTIDQCAVSGSVKGQNAAGGLCGSNGWWGMISHSYAAASVSGNSGIGGLCGYNYGAINACYASGAVKGESSSEYIGGLCGTNSQGKISSSFWDFQTSGTNNGVGSQDPDPSGVMGIDTTTMMMQTTFTEAGWDFVGEDANGTADVWRMCTDGVDYPRLSWEFSRGGDLDCPDGVELEDVLYLAGRWMARTPETVGAADGNGDGRVGIEDLAVMAENWMR